MTNLESILKNRDITLPTKVHLVKAMVFPLVIDKRDAVSIPGLDRSPGEGHGNPSSILTWETPWTEEPGRL